jgi:hypothetical protein
MSTIEIPLLDSKACFSKLQNGHTLIIGQALSGKTNFCYHLLNTFEKRFANFIVIHRSSLKDIHYGHLVSQQFIYDRLPTKEFYTNVIKFAKNRPDTKIVLIIDANLSAVDNKALSKMNLVMSKCENIKMIVTASFPSTENKTQQEHLIFSHFWENIVVQFKNIVITSFPPHWIQSYINDNLAIDNIFIASCVWKDVMKALIARKFVLLIQRTRGLASNMYMIQCTNNDNCPICIGLFKNI